MGQISRILPCSVTMIFRSKTLFSTMKNGNLLPHLIVEPSAIFSGIACIASIKKAGISGMVAL